jgi:hypothetical protein
LLRSCLVFGRIDGKIDFRGVAKLARNRAACARLVTARRAAVTAHRARVTALWVAVTAGAQRHKSGYSAGMLSPRATRTVRWLHLWGGVIVGIQIILWVVSGLVMVARPMDEVRGTVLRREAPASLAMPAQLPALKGVERLELGQLLGRPVWKLTDGQGKRLLDAASGQPIAITAGEAEAVARAGTMMSGPAVVTPVTPAAPASDWREPNGWRVAFGDDTRVYVTTQGEIGAIRTPWWRFYDLFWGLHIMDWQERENTHGPVIIAATLLALGVVLTGALLTVRHFWRR